MLQRNALPVFSETHCALWPARCASAGKLLKIGVALHLCHYPHIAPNLRDFTNVQTRGTVELREMHTRKRALPLPQKHRRYVQHAFIHQVSR